MYDVKLQNIKGDTLTFGYNAPYKIKEIQGLNPPDAVINTTEIALFDGSKFNSSKVNMRQILMSFTIEYDVEENRIAVYKVLKSKQSIRFLYKNNHRDVYVDGYISNISIDLFAVKQTVSLSILCPAPFFKAAQELINSIDSIISKFHFPFAIMKNRPIPLGYIERLPNIVINNDGDIACGLKIELYTRNVVENPKIFNYITGEYIGINFTTKVGDSIFINTSQGEKTIELLRDGIYTNIFNYISKNSTWLQLEPGENVFTYEADKGIEAISLTFTHCDLYEGV